MCASYDESTGINRSFGCFGNAHMRQWTIWSLTECHLLDTKHFPEPMIIYCQTHSSAESNLNQMCPFYNKSHVTKWRLQHLGIFSTCLIPSCLYLMRIKSDLIIRMTPVTLLGSCINTDVYTWKNINVCRYTKWVPIEESWSSNMIGIDVCVCNFI